MSADSNMKIAGCLEKKGKMKMMSTWKKYWFVLEGRLLLYYRSKDEYDALSPCKGSINLGPPCSVKSCPSVAHAFQIETRSSTVTLRAENPFEQKKWMQTIMSILNQNNLPKRLSHFRYSLDDLMPAPVPRLKAIGGPTCQEPANGGKRGRVNVGIIQKLQRMGAHTYGGSLGAMNKLSGGGAPAKGGARPPSECIYDRIVTDDGLHCRRISSYMLDNDNYHHTIPMQKSASLTEDTFHGNVMIENDQYSPTLSAEEQRATEDIYAEPSTIIDHNENSVMLENGLYATNCGGKSTNVENLYEDLEKFIYETPSEMGKAKHRTLNKLKGIFSRGETSSKKGKSLRKSHSFMRRVWKRKKEREEGIYEEVGNVAGQQGQLGDRTRLQMLSELQTILEKKKPLLKTLSNQSLEEPSENARPKCEERPCLPPKHRKHKSIDEILDDLDQIPPPETNVRKLIKKFNEDDVVLRVHDESRPSKTNVRHSDDLNQLLNDLAKVTSAPIMEAGVTTSLINPTITDEEWLKILPIRKRRFSEPDYDVPRSHKFLQFIDENNPENNLNTAQSIGLALTEIKPTEESSIFVSMTPDSLEVQGIESPTYNSHHYYKLDKYNHPNIVYQQQCGKFNIKPKLTNDDIQSNQFKDSLESTVF